MNVICLLLPVLVLVHAHDCLEAEISFLQLELGRPSQNTKDQKAAPQEATTLAQEAAIWPIWPQDEAAPTDRAFEKVLNDDGTNAFAYLNTTFLLAPETPGRADAVLIVVPGGGGINVDLDEGADLAKWANSVGISALLLVYRTPDNYRACENTSYVSSYDLQRAVALVCSRLDSLAVSHVGVIGSSYGGTVITNILKTSKLTYEAVDHIDVDFDHVPDFALLNYPCIDPCLGFDATEPPSAIPVLIQHGMSDPSCPWTESFEWAERRQEVTAANSTEIIIYPHAEHRFSGEWVQDPNFKEEEAGWGKAASRFMKFNLGFDLYPNSSNVLKP